jgi:hypothetical protein
MSTGKVTRIQDALTESSVDLIEVVPAVTSGLKHLGLNGGRIIKASTGGLAEWLEDWEDSVVDFKKVKKFERANQFQSRLRAAELEEAAFKALPPVTS